MAAVNVIREVGVVVTLVAKAALVDHVVDDSVHFDIVLVASSLATFSERLLAATISLIFLLWVL